MMCYDAVKLLHAFACSFLIVFNNAIKMITANADAIKYQLKE